MNQPLSFGKALVAGVAVALSDAIFAIGICVTAGTGCVPPRVFQGIAAALIGREAAIAGGNGTVALGVGLHVLIATIWATMYYAAYRSFAWLRALVATRGGFVTVAIAFGFLVYLVMDFVVVPLSHNRQTPVTSRFFWIILLGHPLFVAAPIVALVRAPRARYVAA